LIIRDLQVIPYSKALSLQNQLAAEVLGGASPDILLLLEHPSVYTIGRGGDENNVLDPAVEVVRINRGGDVTFHGPGQLVGYPLVNLARRGRDLHRYVRFLEEVLIQVAAEFRVLAYRFSGQPGVWSEAGKLASIGIGMRRWTTMHGFAMNVDVDLRWFERINPCGMVGCPVTSLAVASGRAVTIDEVKAKLCSCFTELLEEWLPETD
jgi:lipoyl(octanoyl) transferase